MDQTEAVVLIATQFFHWAVVATQAHYRSIDPKPASETPVEPRNGDGGG